MNDKRRRQVALLRLVRGRAIANQNEIVRLLRAGGTGATQASVSRDIRELGLLKVGGRYVPATRVVARTPSQADSPISELITELSPAGANLIVVRTRIGAASTVAIEIDRAAIPEIMGTVAGDDTVFVAVGSRSAQGRALVRLRRLGLPA